MNENLEFIASVEILGFAESAEWKHEAGAMVVAKPEIVPHKETVGIKITFKN